MKRNNQENRNSYEKYFSRNKNSIEWLKEKVEEISQEKEKGKE